MKGEGRDFILFVYYGSHRASDDHLDPPRKGSQQPRNYTILAKVTCWEMEMSSLMTVHHGMSFEL